MACVVLHCYIFIYVCHQNVIILFTFSTCWFCVQDHDVQCHLDGTVICELGNPLKGNENVCLNLFSLIHVDSFPPLMPLILAFSILRCRLPSYLRPQGSICTHNRSSPSCFCPRKCLTLMLHFVPFILKAWVPVLIPQFSILQLFFFLFSVKFNFSILLLWL